MKVRYATLIVNNMQDSVDFYTKILNFEIEEEFNLPSGKITLLKCEGDAGIELIENPVFETGMYSIGIDVDDIEEVMVNLKGKGVNIAMDITPISVGLMSRIIDPNGINIVFIEHENKMK
ncbi:MAG: VOC family protein [Methanosphaera stadtmanae]|nr:VOC family protein [Methanosphaera stadtmanae]